MQRDPRQMLLDARRMQAQIQTRGNIKDPLKFARVSASLDAAERNLGNLGFWWLILPAMAFLAYELGSTIDTARTEINNNITAASQAFQSFSQTWLPILLVGGSLFFLAPYAARSYTSTRKALAA